VLLFSLKATLSPKTVTDSSGLKVGNPSTEHQHHWHHSVDTRYYLLHVKFEVKFIFSFTRKFTSSKKWHFSWMIGPWFFSKRGRFQILVKFWFYELDDTRETWCLCRQRWKDKVVKSKSEVS
jgi:hypothetical protein